MAKRRANGEGNIRKRKDGRWEGRYTAGRSPDTGKPITKNVLGKTQAEVKEKLKRAIEESGKVDISKAGQYTVAEWCWLWHENYCKPAVKDTTAEYYRSYIEHHIVPNIGSIKLDKLTTLDLQKFYNQTKQSGRVEKYEGMEDKLLSVRTVRGIHAMLRQCLDQAVQERIIPYNPAAACRLPPKEKKEMQILPPEKVGVYLEAAKEHGVLPMFYLELTTGLRRGELVGLKWEDVDLEHGSLRIRRQVARINGEIVEAPLKTKNSYRTLPLAESTATVLKEQRKKAGNSPWVFPSPTGRPMSPDSVLHMLHRVLDRAGLPHIRFHDLRHTLATLALQNGVDIKTVSGMLGHYSAGFTLDTYTHITTPTQRLAAGTMSNILSVGI